MKLIFNFWRKYPRIAPKESGLYLCTLTNAAGEPGEVAILYYSDWKGEWLDLSRQRVFDGYKVYLTGRGEIEETRVYSDGLCDRTQYVMAWKNIPKRKGWWWK